MTEESNEPLPEIPQEEKIKKLVEVIRQLDPEDPDAFTQSGLPELPVIRGLVPFVVDSKLRDLAWREFNVIKKAEPEPDIGTDKEVTMKIDGKEYTVTKKDFVFHGNWTENNRLVSYIWSHKETGVKFFQDNKRTRELGNPIYPFN
jgi:hypothetical protein